MRDASDVLTQRVRDWEAEGGYEEVAGRRLFVHRRDGVEPALLLLHGFPSSSYDWKRLLELRPARAVVAFDCLGFGLSDKPADIEYTLSWQADAAEALVGDREVFVVGHDMGTSVATELMARDLRGELSGMRIAGVLLFNGSILLHRASPTVGQRILRSHFGRAFARLSSERGFALQFGRIFSDAHPLEREEARDQWALLSHRDGNRRLPDTINYMNERERFTERWHGAVRDWPGHLSFAWGLEDPVATTAVLDGLRELRPAAPVTELPGLGHYPQVEAPERLAAALDAALAVI